MRESRGVAVVQFRRFLRYQMLFNTDFCQVQSYCVHDAADVVLIRPTDITNFRWILLSLLSAFRQRLKTFLFSPVFSCHYPLITLRPRGLCNSFAILATLKIFD